MYIFKFFFLNWRIRTSDNGWNAVKFLNKLFYDRKNAIDIKYTIQV